MLNTVRWVRLVTLVSVLAMFAIPALATAQSSARSGDAFCLYPGKTTDTPEVGPMPCDTSRPYMIGHRNLGDSRIPADSEFNTGPKSHLNRDGSAPAAVDSSDQADGTSASPLSGAANSTRTPDVEAP